MIFILFLFQGEGWYCWLDLVYVCIITDRKLKCYLIIQNIIFEGLDALGLLGLKYIVMQISRSCFIIALLSVICLVYKHKCNFDFFLTKIEFWASVLPRYLFWFLYDRWLISINLCQNENFQLFFYIYALHSNFISLHNSKCCAWE